MLSVAIVEFVVFVCNTLVVRAFPTGHVRCGYGRHCHIRLRHSVVECALPEGHTVTFGHCHVVFAALCS